MIIALKFKEPETEIKFVVTVVRTECQIHWANININYVVLP